jgi:hypothetical protein
MAITRKDGNGHHGYVGPVAWIIALVFSYWLIYDWRSLSGLLGSAFAMILS